MGDEDFDFLVGCFGEGFGDAGELFSGEPSV